MSVPRQAKPLLLLVDDEAANLQLLRHILQDDYALLFAKDGARALALAQQERPALILLDVMMPGDLNGYQVCQHIKDDPTLAHTTVMLITARGQQADLEEGARVRADAYLVKPFSPIQLLDLVTQTLGEGRTP